MDVFALDVKKKNPSSFYRTHEWKKQYFEKNPTKRLLWAAKKRAKEKQLEFNIEESDIIIPSYCPYLQIPLNITAKRGEQRTNVISLDRIDNSKGYIKGNIEVISHLANSIKSNATPEQLLKFSKEILKRYG